MLETTALGAAYLAGLAVGYWESVDDYKNNGRYREFNPEMSRNEADKLVHNWDKARACFKLDRRLIVIIKTLEDDTIAEIIGTC
jgi:glycerol kinase